MYKSSFKPIKKSHFIESFLHIIYILTFNVFTNIGSWPVAQWNKLLIDQYKWNKLLIDQYKWNKLLIDQYKSSLCYDSKQNKKKGKRKQKKILQGQNPNIFKIIRIMFAMQHICQQKISPRR